MPSGSREGCSDLEGITGSASRGRGSEPEIRRQEVYGEELSGTSWAEGDVELLCNHNGGQS